MRKTNESGTGAANIVGAQVSPFLKKREKEARALVSSSKIEEKLGSFFLVRCDEQCSQRFFEHLDRRQFSEAVRIVRKFSTEGLIREAVKNRVKEVVRKKPGGGGFVLYSPNQGKKKPPKAVGDFPTKLMAKRAELARFPPKDIEKLKRLRKEIEKLSKDPKKRDERENGKKDSRKESLARLSDAIRRGIREGLFREEQEGSHWEERVAKLSKAAVATDKRLQGLQKNIEKKSEGVLHSALKAISSSLKGRGKVKDEGLKKDLEKKRQFLQFSIVTDTTSIGPLYVFVESGVPRIEISDDARAAMTKLDPDDSKMIRAELITVQEDRLNSMTDVGSAIEARDKYLDKLEQRVDGFVSGLSGLEVSVLKNLLVQKYRGK